MAPYIYTVDVKSLHSILLPHPSTLSTSFVHENGNVCGGGGGKEVKNTTTPSPPTIFSRNNIIQDQ